MSLERKIASRAVTIEPARELEVLNRVHAKLEADTRLDPSARRLTLAFADGVLTVDGEVDTVASKKRVLENVAGLAEVRWVVDRLRVTPSTRMQDGQIRDHVRDALIEETEFRECKLVVVHDGVEEVAHDPVVAHGSIRLGVAEGVVTLDGEVPSWSHRRLAGVLAWWVPGTRDVENRLGVEPLEWDSDDEITDAVRLVLEREPLLDADQLRASTRNARVTLVGTVASDEQKRIAERDAWLVFGVDEVANDISVLLNPMPTEPRRPG